MRRRGAALLLVLLLALPGAFAHVEYARPSLQPREPDRTPVFDTRGAGVTIDLLLTGDPLRHLVRHAVDPGVMEASVLHRPDASSTEGQALVRFRLLRLVEYADRNLDARFQPQDESVARSWRFSSQAWNETPTRNVSVGGLAAQSVLWEARAQGGPSFSLEAVAAGRPFTDEGARVRAQDVAFYASVHGLPPRAVGNLFALEGAVVTPPGASVRFDRAGNATVALVVDQDARRAFLVWGGEARLDGQEQRVSASLLDAETGPDGNVTQRFLLHLPLFDHGAELLLVSGIEYATPVERPSMVPASPLAPLLLALLAALALARPLAGGRRR